MERIGGCDCSSSSFSTASRRIRFNIDAGTKTEPAISALSPASSYGVLPSLENCSISVASVSPRFCAALNVVGDSTMTESALGKLQRVCRGGATGRGAQCGGCLHYDGKSAWQAPASVQRLVPCGGRVQCERLLRDGRHRVKIRTHHSIQFRVVRAP